MKNFDEIIKLPFEENVIEYGIIKGNNTVCFLKAGANGSMRGYQDKYLEIGKNLHEKYGYTVVCSSNPYAIQDSLSQGIEVIEKYIQQPYQVYYMGFSNGALQGARNAHLFSQIKRMLLVNGPLVLNLNKTKEGILKFKGEKIVLAYGTEDPSFKYVGLLDNLLSEKVSYISVQDADHNFVGKLDDFKGLFEQYLIKNDAKIL